jgi:translocation and assembly module TamA
VEVERELPRNFGVAVFYDAGNAFDDFDDDLEYSAGLGVRYRLAGVASIGVDVAQALSDTSRSPRFHLRLTTLF